MSHYRSYAGYKASGVDCIGEVPEHWDVVRVARLGTLRKANGGSKEDNVESGVPCVRYGDLYTTHDHWIRHTPTFIAEEKATEYTPIRYGDVLFAASGETFEEIGKSAVNLLSESACCGGDVIILRPSGDADPLFLGYALDCSATQVQKARMGKGFTVKHIYADELRNLIVALPPADEQRVIAASLEREAARIDAIIAKKTRFVDLVTRKILAMAGRLTGDSGCQWTRLQHLVEVINRPVNQLDGEAYTRLGLYNRGRGIFKKKEVDNEDIGDSDFFWVSRGDLILSGQFAWEGAVGIAGADHEGCVVSHRFPVITGRTEVALTEYLYAILLTHYGDFILNDCSRGSAGRNRPLNLSMLLKWKIPVPSLEYQEKIARLVVLREQIQKKTQQSIDLLKNRRSALITAAVTGQIDLRESV